MILCQIAILLQLEVLVILCTNEHHQQKLSYTWVKTNIDLFIHYFKMASLMEREAIGLIRKENIPLFALVIKFLLHILPECNRAK